MQKALENFLVVLQFLGELLTELVERRMGRTLFRPGQNLIKFLISRVELLHQSFGLAGIVIALLGLMGLVLAYF